MNSIVVAVVVTAGNLLFCSMLGYALAMLDFRAGSVLFAVVMGDADDPRRGDLRAAVRPRANAGLVDTLPGLFLPFLVSPFGVFLMRQYIIGPAAGPARRRTGRRGRRADGSSRGSSCRCAVLPSRRWASSPSSAAGTTSSGRSSWPRPRSTYTLPVALALYSKGQNSHELRPAPRRRHRRRHADPRWSSSPSSAGSSRASPPPASSSHHERSPTMSEQNRPPVPRRRSPAARSAAPPAVAAARGSSRPRAPRAPRHARPACLGCRRSGTVRDSRLMRWAARHLAQPRRDDRPADRAAGRQHPRVARCRRPLRLHLADQHRRLPVVDDRGARPRHHQRRGECTAPADARP